MGLYEGISHLAFDCEDIEKSLDFYVNKMGFERIMHLGDDKNPWLIYLKISHGNYLELFPTKDSIDKSARHCYSHLCIAVFDIFETVKVLRSRGADVEDPHMGMDRNYQAWLCDPDGNRIELMQMMPDCMQFENDPE